MASITLTPSEKEIQAFVQKYEQSLTPSKNPYIRYFLKLSQASVSVYTSGKVLLQGEMAENYFLVISSVKELADKISLCLGQMRLGMVPTSVVWL